MKQKSQMEILQEIRNFRNSELNESGKTNIAVVKVDYLGIGKDTEKDIYRLTEEMYFEDKPTEIIEKFYEYNEEMPKLVAAKMPNSDILPTDLNRAENEEWDIMKNDIETIIEQREEQLQKVAEALGISKEEIKNMSEIDLEQKIYEGKENSNGKLKDENREDEREGAKTERLTEKQVKSIGARNEIDTNIQIDSKGTTLKKEAGLDYDKIIPVYSEKLSEFTDDNGNKGNRTISKFGWAGKKGDSYEAIPPEKISLYRGGNREVTTIKNPQEVQTQKEENIFEIKGSRKRLVVNQSDTYGVPKVSLAESTRDNEGNIAEELQDKYDGTQKADIEVRKLFNSNQGTEHINEMYAEAEEHINANCDELTLDEVDGDENTGHKHQITIDSVLEYEGKQMTVEEIANLPRFKISAKEFVEKYNRISLDMDDLEQIYAEIEDEVNSEATRPMSH